MSIKYWGKNDAVHSNRDSATLATIEGLKYQGITRRAGAIIIDLISIMVITLIISTFLQTLFNYSQHLLIMISYFTVLEALFGQTLGKRIFGIRVVTVNGKPINPLHSLVRNLLRIIDILPVFYLIGTLSIYFSDKKQRVGDRIAKTVVIRDI